MKLNQTSRQDLNRKNDDWDAVHSDWLKFQPQGLFKHKGPKTETQKDINKDVDAIAEQVNEYLTVTPIPTMVIAALKDLPDPGDKPSPILAIYKKKYGTDLTQELTAKLPKEWLPIATELITPVKDGVISKTPTQPEEMSALALKLQKAISGDDAVAAIAILLAFDRNPEKVLELKKAYHKLKKKKDATKADLSAGLSQLERDINFSGDNYSYVMYLLNGLPPAEDEGLDLVQQQDKGALKDKTHMLGGDVTYHEGTSYKLGKDSHYPGEQRGDSYKLSYSGGLSEETRWLQFVWRLVTPQKDGKSGTPLSFEWESGRTTSPSAGKNLYVDGYTQFGLPYYEGGEVDIGDNKKDRQGGAHIRGKNETSIFDAPKSLNIRPEVREPLSNGSADAIVSQVTTISYLVRHFMPVRKYTTTYQWVITDKTDQTKEPKPSVSQAVEAVNGLDEATWDVMIQSAPQLKYIRKADKK
jgi:hypothetical protein